MLNSSSILVIINKSMFTKRKSKQGILTRKQISFYYSSITHFIHSNKNRSNPNSSLFLDLQIQRLPYSFCSIFEFQMLNSLNEILYSIYCRNNQFHCDNQSVYLSLLRCRLTCENQKDNYEISMNDQLYGIFDQNLNKTWRKKEKSFPKSKTFYKTNSYQKDISKVQKKSISLTNDNLSSDDLCRDRNIVDSGTFETQTIDDISNRNTIRSISPIKEENDNNKILTKRNLLTQQISKISLLNKYNKLRNEYSTQVRLSNMLDIPQENIVSKVFFKTSYIQKYINVFNGDIYKHDNSIMNYLFENATNSKYLKNICSLSQGTNNKTIRNKKEKNDFEVNLGTIKINKKPSIHRIKSKKRKIFKRSNSKPFHQIIQKHHNTQINFIELFNKYIEFDESYNLRIIHHRKVYSQQYTTTQRKLSQIDSYKSKGN